MAKHKKFESILSGTVKNRNKKNTILDKIKFSGDPIYDCGEYEDFNHGLFTCSELVLRRRVF